MTVADIENAILATLKADSTLSGYVREQDFKSLPGLDEESLKAVIVRFPAIGIFSTSGDYDYATSGIIVEIGTFSLLCFNRNLRSATAALQPGACGEPGLWDLVEDCRKALSTGSLSGVVVSDCLPQIGRASCRERV